MPSRPAAKLILMTAQPSESWVPRRRWVPDESRQLAANYTVEDRRDRFQKPGAYAGAGIPHYWRIEQDPVHVYAYDLDATGAYQLIADSDTELVLSRPFEIRLPIGAITG